MCVDCDNRDRDVNADVSLKFDDMGRHMIVSAYPRLMWLTLASNLGFMNLQLQVGLESRDLVNEIFLQLETVSFGRRRIIVATDYLEWRNLVKCAL